MCAMRSIVVTVLLGLLAAGCAASRSELAVSVPKPSAAPTKAAVKIVNVADKRAFQVDPRQPSIPSVRGNEIGNTALTSRAVGRKRGGYGNAWGDVVLPEGQTVSGLVEQVLSAALADKGYAVVEQGAAGYDTALPLSADIIKFWSWVNFGLDIKITHESLIRLKGPWPVAENDREARGRAFYNSFVAIVESDWIDLLNNGTGDLRKNVAQVLK